MLDPTCSECRSLCGVNDVFCSSTVRYISRDSSACKYYEKKNTLGFWIFAATVGIAGAFLGLLLCAAIYQVMR